MRLLRGDAREVREPRSLGKGHRHDLDDRAAAERGERVARAQPAAQDVLAGLDVLRSALEIGREAEAQRRANDPAVLEALADLGCGRAAWDVDVDPAAGVAYPRETQRREVDVATSREGPGEEHQEP